MKNQMRVWLESDQQPADYYDLLGHRRLDPGREELLQAVLAASRVVQSYESHRDPTVFERARQLQGLLGQASKTFSQPGLLRAYEARVVERLRQLYAAGNGSNPGLWRAQNLRRWLDLVQRVHRDRVEEIVMGWIPSSDSTANPSVDDSPVELCDIPGPVPGKRPLPVPISRPLGPAPGTPSEPDPAKPGTGPSKRPPIPPTRPSSPGRPAPTVQLPVGRTLPTQPMIPTRPKSLFGAGSRGQGRGDRTPRIPLAPMRGPSRPRSDVVWIVVSAVISTIVLTVVVLVLVLPKLMSAGSGRVVVRAPAESPRASRRTLPPVPKNAPQRPRPDVPREPMPEPAGNSPAPPSPPPTPVAAAETPPTIATPPVPAPKPNSPSPEAASKPPDTTPQGTPSLLNHERPVLAVAWGRDGRELASAGEDGRIFIWEAATGRLVRTLAEHQGAVRCLSWTTRLASAGEDGLVRIWTPGNWSVQKESGQAAAHPLEALAWTPDGRQLLIGDDRGQLSLAGLSADRGRQSLEGFAPGAVRAIGMPQRAGEEKFAVGYLDGSVAVWDVGSRGLRRAILPAEARTWEDIREGRPTALRRAILAPGTLTEVRSLAISPDDKWLAVAGGDVEIWDLTPAKANIRTCLLPGRSESKGYRAVSWSPDGRLLVAGDGTGEITVWETTRWRAVFTAKYGGRIHAVAFSPPDGKAIAVAPDDKTVRVLPGNLPPDTAPLDAFFDADKTLDRAVQMLRDSDWSQLARALSLLNMCQLPSAARERLQRLRLDITRDAKAALDTLDASAQPSLESWATAQDLQAVDPQGEIGQRARSILERGLAPPAAAAANNPARPDNRSSTANPRPGTRRVPSSPRAVRPTPVR